MTSNVFSKLNKDHFRKAIAPEGEKILVHTSNFRKVKRVEDIIHVFKQIRDEMPAKLLLVGDGPERLSVEYLSRNLGVAQDVRFLGKQDAVEEILAISDLFFLPSESESFGLAALEAMACEVPVISSDAGGIPEVNIHGETGFVLPVGDIDGMAAHSLRLLMDQDLLKKFRANALEQAKQFDIDKILPHYEAYYRKIRDELLVNAPAV